MQKDNKTEPGSFTVEAAFIVPILFAVILGLLQLALVLHDRITAEALINDSLFGIREELEGKKNGRIDFAGLSKSRIFFRNEAEVLSEAEERLHENAAKNLLISEFTELETGKSLSKISIEATLKSKSIIPDFGLFDTGIGATYYEISFPLFGREEKTRAVSVIFEELVRLGIVKN